MRKGIVTAVCGLIAVAAIGCSSSSAMPTPILPGDNGNYAGPTMAPAPAATPAPAAQPAPAATPAPDATGLPPGISSGPAAAAVNQDQIIKTGSITIEVAGIDDAIAVATDQMHVLGGWLASSDRTSNSGVGVAQVTFRVPVASFENALGLMRKLGKKVISEKSDSQSVGGQIVDLQARIDNLKASEKAIQAIMTQAKTIPDVLEVQQRLTDVQGQIEELTAQVTGLSGQAAYSTLTVVFETPPPVASPTPTPSPTATPVPWSAGDQFNQAAGQLGGVGQNGATWAIWTVVLILPVALALLLLLILLMIIGRIMDPIRRRLLPVSVAQPGENRATGWGAAAATRPQPTGWVAPNTPAPPVVAAEPAQSAPGPETPNP